MFNGPRYGPNKKMFKSKLDLQPWTTFIIDWSAEFSPLIN